MLTGSLALKESVTVSYREFHLEIFQTFFEYVIKILHFPLLLR